MGALELWIVLGLVAMPLLLLVWRARQALTLFVVQIQAGRVTDAKGRMPQRLLDEIASVAEREHVAGLVVTCRIEGSLPQLFFRGATNSGLEQTLRNLVGQYPLARLKHAPRIRR